MLDQQTLSFIVGVIVVALVAVFVYEAGRKQGEAGILARLQDVDHSKPTLDALEGLVTSFPGDAAERIISQLIAGYGAVRTLIPGEPLRAIGDVVADIGDKVSDGKPNEYTTGSAGFIQVDGANLNVKFTSQPPADPAPVPEPPLD